MTFTRLYDIARNFIARYRLGYVYTFVLILSAILLGYLTYRSFTSDLAFSSGTDFTFLLLNLDLGVLLLLSTAVARRVIIIRSATKFEGAGSRLSARLVRWFGLLLVTPSIIIALFSAVFFNMGVESWFNQRVQSALTNSQEVADAYLSEHIKLLTADIQNIRKDISVQLNILTNNPEVFDDVLNQYKRNKNLAELIVFAGDHNLIAKSDMVFSLLLEPVSEVDLDAAREGTVIISQSAEKDRVRALVRISPISDLFLVVGKFVDPKVIAHLNRTKHAVSEYKQLQSMRWEFEVKFVLIFIAFSILLLLSVIWIALAFAKRLATPIGELIATAEQVRSGDLSARAAIFDERDELGLLCKSFNNMTAEVESQRTELIKVNKKLAQRNHFIEAVLSGVRSGIIGLDSNGKINLANSFASELLHCPLEKKKGLELVDVVPAFAEILNFKDRNYHEIEFIHDDVKVTLVVQVTADKSGYVITFDDISELIAAQRKAAWSEIARRIAHEIKNPLTPIQLSAERLRTKYSDMLKEDDRANFEKYIGTIARQVAHIGDMIQEFSEFARMPDPVMSIANIVELCEQALFLQKIAYPKINFVSKYFDSKIMINCDSVQIEQVLTNLIKNAIEALDSLETDQDKNIALEVSSNNDSINITLTDNGPGFPKDSRDRLMDPYFTLREKGTGLGLAIVKRIIDDHEGTIKLEEAPGGGARVSIRLGVVLDNDNQQGRVA